MSSASSSSSRKSNDFESQRATQYRDRISSVKVPAELTNGSEWDTLSRKIWAKFDERRQPQDSYEKKIRLWTHLSHQTKV